MSANNVAAVMDGGPSVMMIVVAVTVVDGGSN